MASDVTQTSRAGVPQLIFWARLGAALAALLLTGATPVWAHRTGTASTPPITPEILVANYCSRDVTVYPLGSNGDVAPLGPVPAFSSPRAVAVDGQNNLYVLDSCTGAIEVFAPGSSGNAAPIASIGGNNSGFSSALAVDHGGDIFAVQFDSVAIFGSGSNGNVSPTAVISGPDTGFNLGEPIAIAVDPSSNIYVANLQGGSDHTGSVTGYAAGSVNDAKPIATISGPDTGLEFGGRDFGYPSIAADSKGQIYALNPGYEDPRQIFPNISSTIAVYAPGSDGDAKPIHTITGPDTGLHTYSAAFGSKLATDSGGNIYVANFSVVNSRLQPLTTTAAVEVFAPGSDRDASPSAVISGPDTGLAAPNALALDSAGNIYVADSGYRAAVHVYAAGSTGDAAPVRTLGGPSVPFSPSPTNAAVDGKGNFYVLSTGLPADAIDVYPAGSNGAGPIATISGPHTGLQQPRHIAVNSQGDIYVTDFTSDIRPSGGGEVITFRRGSKGDARPVAVIASGELNSGPVAVGPSGLIYAEGWGGIAVYRPGSRGNPKPYAILRGAATGLSIIQSIAVDSCSKLYVAQEDPYSQFSISVFAPHKFGNVAPIAVISGPDTGLTYASQIAVDSSGKIYVAGAGNNVPVYAPGSSGDSTPLAVIAGPHTGLGGPIGIAIAEPPPDPHSHPRCR